MNNRAGKRLPWGWRIFARLFTGMNVLGFIYGVAMSEPLHAAGHMVLQLVGITAYLIWRFSARDVTQHTPQIDPTSQLLDRIQQSVDKIALDVERVSESQRFQAKILEKRSTHEG